MPKISEWGSVSIFINTRGEHNPPHFHAVSAEWEASIRISDFGIMAGKLPPRQLGEVVATTSPSWRGGSFPAIMPKSEILILASHSALTA